MSTQQSDPKYDRIARLFSELSCEMYNGFNFRAVLYHASDSDLAALQRLITAAQNRRKFT